MGDRFAKFEITPEPRVKDILDAFRLKMSCQKATLLEERYKLTVKPRGWWMPRWLWKRLVRMTLRVEVEVL